jgi:hypothetical protein
MYAVRPPVHDDGSVRATQYSLVLGAGFGIRLPQEARSPEGVGAFA